MQKLTEPQAYAAMVRFLEGIYRRTKSSDLGGLLGGLAVLPDGRPADPAVEADWGKAVEAALSSGAPVQRLG